MFYYVEEIEEESVSILPEKKTSTHFPGFTYQTVICRICKQPVGYLYSPTPQEAGTAAYSGIRLALQYQIIYSFHLSVLHWTIP